MVTSIDYSSLEQKTGHTYDVVSKGNKHCLVFSFDSGDDDIVTVLGAVFYDANTLQEIIDQAEVCSGLITSW